MLIYNFKKNKKMQDTKNAFYIVKQTHKPIINTITFFQKNKKNKKTYFYFFAFYTQKNFTTF